MKILILGYIVKGPLAGMSLHYLQYVLGLKYLGHEVLFYEDSDDFASCYNPETYKMSINPEYGLNYTQKLFNNFGLKENWTYYDNHSGIWYGLGKNKALSFCNEADIVLNISGANPLREWWTKIPCRVLIDTDPLYTQVKHLTNKNALIIAQTHTHFYSFGENFGNNTCSIPLDGFLWKPTRQPVFLPIWKETESICKGNWTTIMQWQSYKDARYNGKTYGMKSVSFSSYFKLPEYLKDEKFELAASGTPNPTKLELIREGWQIEDPILPSKSFESFQNYIASSKGEWTVAKQGYVETNSGWFSERTLNYMASGKPVIVQDTGFSNFLPIGQGLLSFSNIEEAVDQIKRVNLDYKLNCKQARRIVEKYFNSNIVLQSLLMSIN